MKIILYIDHTANLSGGELALLNLLRHIDRSRFAPAVVLFSKGPLAAELRKADIPVHLLELDAGINKASRHAAALVTLNPRRLLAAIAFIRRLRRKIRQLKPDIVHTNSLKADVLGGIAARLAGVKVLWHIRDRISADYLSPRTATIMRFLARGIPYALIANSRSTLATLQLPPRKPATVVYSGLPDPNTESLPSAAGQNVIMVGRISPWKGQDVFIQAAAIVLRQLPQVKFQIVGSAMFGENAYDQQIRTLVEQLNLQEAVTFLGFRSDVPELIAKASLLVHASTTPEPFGQVVVQAMAASRPAIATGAGGITEIVVDQQTGLLVPIGDVEAMAAAIVDILSNPARAAAMGRAGRKRYLEEFTIQKSAARVMDFYEAILCRKSEITSTEPSTD